MFFQTTTSFSQTTMSSSTSSSHPLVGHFVESTSSTTSSSTISANSTLSPPPPVVSEVPQARGREKTRAFSPIRVGSGVKGLFGKKRKAVEAAGKIEELVDSEGGKREEVVLSSGVVGEVEAAGALVEGGKVVGEVGKAGDASSVAEEVKVEADGKKADEKVEDEEKKKVELVETPLVEPILAPPPQQLVLTPESIVAEDHPTTVNKLESPEPSSFSPVEISLQIKTMLQRFLPDDSELAPPPNQAHLLALLGRPDVMNGEDRGDDDDESTGLSSVWKCLEHASHDSFCSIMVSCDLDFSTTPVVTLASWMDFGGPSEEGRVDASSSSAGGWLPSWPWGKKQQPVTPVPGEGGVEKVVRVWYPSKTKLSLHATWWGFSIYLPPPIMLVLNDGQVGTLKRISALTQGLTFLIKFLPGLLDLGPGMLVALALLGSLVPMISFIASFIAWTWTTIHSYDKGKGVILSATWLCPLLLITRSWDAPSPPSSLIAAASDEKSLLVPVSEVESPLVVVEEVQVVA